MIDDYLAVRGDREATIRDLVTAGRLSCGPWVTLVDQFLVSGESILRNLEDGIARAQELGADGWIGYLPDQFGHIGQMPQILRTAGIDRAVVWRGVPAAIDRTAFEWFSPDGSSVTAVYLPFGYGQGRDIDVDPEALMARLDVEEERLTPFSPSGEPLLLMVGDDHEVVKPRLSASLSSVGEDRARITSLVEHSESLAAPRLEWHGELRSAARANLLPNTYSVRPEQKLARARAEHLLERYAEPLAALVDSSDWPAEELKEAWMLLHLNGAHDSVCGCSTDEVADAVDERTQSAAAIAQEIARDAAARLATSVAGEEPLLFNPSPFERNGIGPLGYRRAPLPQRAPVRTHARAGEVLVGDLQISFEDQDDEGDLYNFAPASEPSLAATSEDGETIVARGDGWEVSVEAEGDPSEPFVVLDLTVFNHRPDHRLRILLDLPGPASETRAGAPLEIVARPMRGEGGPGESASACWPARGFVTAGGSGFLTEGVVEYELVGQRKLALTLMRCTGTISRDHALSTRLGPAGPDVPTPGAQLIGETRFRLGLLRTEPSRSIMEVWERFALPLLVSDVPGEGGTPGELLDISVPALSSIRRVGDEVAVRIFNPFGREEGYRIGSVTDLIAPFRIETVCLPRRR